MASGPGSSSGSIADALGAPRQRRADWQSDIPQRLVLQSFTAHERLSVPYIIQAEVAAPGGPIDFVPHLGKGAHIIVNTDGLPTRRFHGFLFSAEQSESGDHSGERYRLELRPWLYFLKQVTHWRIFQAKTVVEVLTAVVGDYGRGFNLDTTTLKGNYAAREYVCQFGESDFDFLSRLMEEEGIYYFFDFRPDGHWLVACDGAGSHKTVGAVQHRPLTGGAREGVWRFDRRVHRVVKTAQITDYDFQKAKEKIQATEPGKGDEPLAPGFVRDYPADINSSSQIAQLAPKRLQGLRAEGALFDVESDHLELTVGGLFDLAGHTSPELNTSYLAVGLSLAFANPSPRSGGGDASMHLALEAAPKAAPWRPARVTPKRIARGPQTAVVVGPDKEEIHTDKWGRVRVRFHWDESTPAADKKGQDSCWMRVSNSWAGPDMGEVFLPRIGHEVIIDFLDGDPERPIVTGRVYNSENLPPIAEKNKTMSGWKSQTVYGELHGNANKDYDGAVNPELGLPGYSAVIFEDESGKEALFVHSHRDLRVSAFRDTRDHTYRDRENIVGRNLTATIQTGDEHRTIQQGSRTTTIHKDENHTVETGNRTTTISQKETLTVESGDMTTNVKLGNQSTQLDSGSQSTTISMGNQDTKLDLGKMTTDVFQSITLKVGQNSIVIDQTGITIKGMMVTVEGQAMLTAKSPITEVDGNGMLTLKGGITMIN